MVKRTDKKKHISKHAEIGLIFPITRITRFMREMHSNYRYSQQSGVSMAACLEYIVKEILDLSVECCKEHGRKRLKSEDIREAIRKDPALQAFFETQLGSIISL